MSYGANEQSLEKWRKRLQPDSMVMGGHHHIISQQTNSKQEEQQDQACFQGFTELPPGDWWLLFYGWTLFLPRLPHSNNNHRAKPFYSAEQENQVSYKAKDCVAADWRIYL